MKPTAACLIALVLIVAVVPEAGADFLVYRLGTKGQRRWPRGMGARGAARGSSAVAPPSDSYGGQNAGGGGQGREVVLYGTVKKEGTGIAYSHPEVGEQVIFETNQVEIKRAPTFKMEFNKLMGKAGKDPEAVLQAAAFALKKGLLTEFHIAISKVLSLNPRHERALRIHELKKQVDEPIADDNNAAIEKHLRKLVGASSMQVETSKHFLLLHDTQARSEGGKRLTRAKERLRLLEQMYERFVYLFELQNVPLELPHDRMTAVLFRQLSDFTDLAGQREISLDQAAGFWSPSENLIVFYDDSTTEEAADLRDERTKLDKVASDAKKSGLSLERQRDTETLRQIKINSVLLDIDRWNSDVATVSREATMLLAANTGLLPQRVAIPRWVREGLASYFESPADEAWGGIGAVDESRLDDYGLLRDSKIASNVEFIIGDGIFSAAANRRPLPPRAAQVWALTHFLFENHLPELIAYYKLLGNMPADVNLSPEILRDLFSVAFGADYQRLEQEWRSYMRTLKTDVDRMEIQGDKAE